MNKARLLALAGTVAAAGAGSLLFVDWDTGQTVQAPLGGLEILAKENCTQAACNAPLCLQANDVLADAGSACITRLGTCDFRVGQQARNWAADAGLTLGPSKYQRLRVVGLRCAGSDGGFSFGVPMDPNGLPQFASVAQQTPLCVRAPVAGGMGCQRSEGDGGFRYFGAGNVFPSSLSNGHASCEPVNCAVVYGDNPDSDL